MFEGDAEGLSQSEEGEKDDHRGGRAARPGILVAGFIEIGNLRNIDQRGEGGKHDDQVRQRDLALFNIDQPVDAPDEGAEQQRR